MGFGVQGKVYELKIVGLGLGLGLGLGFKVSFLRKGVGLGFRVSFKVSNEV